MTLDMTLEKLVEHMVSNPWHIGLIPQEDSTHRIEDVTSITWYRYGQFQIQIFAVPPRYIVPEHTHPNVDSYEIMLGGRILFSKHGRWITEEDFDVATQNEPPLSYRRGSIIRVRPNDLHGGISGATGGVFMSVQHWLNGVEPHCVAKDYTGKTMGDHHLSTVKVGDAESKGGQANLTFKDAAGQETDVPWEYLGMEPQ